MNLFRKKSVSALLAQSEQKGASLKKELGAFDLTMSGSALSSELGFSFLPVLPQQNTQDPHLFCRLFYPV